jgi:lysophospholipase L1-like esterase
VGRFRRVLAVGITWAAILVVGAVGVEMYARHTQGYLLWTWSLKHINFLVNLDRLKLWNRKFYEQHREHFAGWPIPLEFFDAASPVPQYLFKPNLRMTLRGGIFAPAGPGDPVIWSSNAWGFRGPQFTLEKPPGVIRIVCLGASTTEGSQYDNQTYPYYLQQELSRAYPTRRIEVINAGHHAYDINDLHALLEMWVLPLKPDVIVFYEARNNIHFPSYIASPLPCTLGSCWLRNYPVWYRWLYLHSAAFVRLWHDRLGWNALVPPPMRHRFDDSSPTANEVHFRAVLGQIVQEAQQHGSRIVLSSFITVAHEGLKVTYAENPGMFDELYKSFYPLTAGEVARAFVDFNRASADVAAAFKVPYADVAAEFPREVRYFPFDIVHLSPEGNRLLASEFAKFLQRNVLPAFAPEQPRPTSGG